MMLLGSCCQSLSPVATYNLHVNGYRHHFPIYMQIDENFSSQQNSIILDAAKDWERASSDTIKFDLDFNHPEPSIYFKDDDVNNGEPHFMWYVPFTPIELGWNQYLKNPTALALTYYGQDLNSNHEERVKIIIASDRTEAYNFKQVVKHELGHAIGMDHIKNKISVMHPFALVGCITPADAEQLCKLYHCVPKPECLEGMPIDLPILK